MRLLYINHIISLILIWWLNYWWRWWFFCLCLFWLACSSTSFKWSMLKKFIFLPFVTQILFCFIVYKTINSCWNSITSGHNSFRCQLFKHKSIYGQLFSNTCRSSFSSQAWFNTIHVEGRNNLALCSVLLAIQEIKHLSAGVKNIKFPDAWYANKFPSLKLGKRCSAWQCSSFFVVFICARFEGELRN